MLRTQNAQTPTTVLFVGHRRPALDAALDLGLRVVVVDEHPRRTRRHVHPIECSFEDSQTNWSAVARGIAEHHRVAAVLALTERSVVPAARLRQHLDTAGDGVDVAVRVTDKLVMKKAVAAAGIPCAPFVELGTQVNREQLVEELGLPLVIKARVGSGGRTNRVVRRRREVPERLPQGYMAESFVNGTEMSFESLLAEGKLIFTNPTEYFRVRWASIAPAPLPPSTLEAINQLNTRALQALGVQEGFTHLELFLTPQGPVFSELAARPPGGYLTDLIDLAYGFDPWQAWLRLALGEKPRLPRSAQRFAGAWLFHPGAGEVKRIAGLSAAQAVPGVERLAIRVKPGMKVKERQGAGQEAGHVLVTGNDRSEVEERLRQAHRKVRFQMAQPSPS